MVLYCTHHSAICFIQWCYVFKTYTGRFSSFIVTAVYIPWCEYVTVYIHSPLDEHLDYFHLFCYYKDVTYILVNASRCICVRVSLEVELLNHRVYAPSTLPALAK